MRDGWTDEGLKDYDDVLSDQCRRAVKQTEATLHRLEPQKPWNHPERETYGAFRNAIDKEYHTVRCVQCPTHFFVRKDLMASRATVFCPAGHEAEVAQSA